MEAVINGAVAFGMDLMGPFAVCVSAALGLFLATGAAARLLTMIEDLTPIRRNS
jgi:hypothetical protein